jgi:hypothetical protein
MAEPILHNSSPDESNKSELKFPEICLNGNQYQSPEISESILVPEGLRPLIKTANVCYLPGPADHCVGILEETITNLTRLHEDLREIEKMLVNGGEL